MRLTIKDENGYWHEDVEIYGREQRIEKRIVKTPVGTKLGQLEDIEDELSIDLITLFKALKNGVYYFTNNQLTKDNVWLINDYISLGFNDRLSYSLITNFEKKILSFKDYGKNWALTKEELL